MKKKALESLAASDHLLRKSLVDSAMNRLYYALFQAGVHALAAAGKRPEDFSRDARDGKWSHALLLQNASLVRGRRDDRRLFMRVYDLRVQADYETEPVEATQVESLEPMVREFVGELCS